MFADDDPRLSQLLEGIVRLASGDLTSRIEVSPARDELDAIIMGTNLLAEDLQIIYDELEQRVQVRTQLLHEAHLEMQKMAMQDPLTGLANRSALLKALHETLGDDAFTPEVEQAWATVYGELAEAMIGAQNEQRKMS